MAKNPNPKLPNEHTMYLGKSGSGKSEALRQNRFVPKRGVRHILWDISHDHSTGTAYFSNRKQFMQAINKAIKSGKGFRIAWDGDAGTENHEWFCQVVRAVLDGNHITYVTNEELAACVQTAGKAAPCLQWLQNEGRKYGLIMNSVSQFPEEIPKTVYKNAARLFIGIQQGTSIKRFAKILDVSESDISTLTPWEFYYYDVDSGQDAMRLKLKGYKSQAGKNINPLA